MFIFEPSKTSKEHLSSDVQSKFVLEFVKICGSRILAEGGY